MTNKKAIEVLKSWCSVAYQNTDGTDESSAELYEAICTIFHIINLQHEQTEKLQEVIFKQEETMQMIAKEKQEYFDELQTAKSEAIKEFAERLKENITNCHVVSDGEYVGYDWTDITHCIDNLVKEMTGDKE